MKILFTILVAIVGLSACSPVNYFTKLQKLPREYSDNYQIEGVKAPKNDIHKTPWIVWSDRADNASFLNPGGRIKKAQLNFGDSLLVIKQKGEYLKLIKYNAGNIKNNRLTARKKAEYIGWVHHSRLILSPSSVTDVRSGLKEKMMIVMKDTASLFHPRKYLVNTDSVKIYNTPDLDKSTSAIGLNEIVYVLKTSDNGSGVLLSRTAEIQNDKIKDQLIGWMAVNTLQPIGRQLYVKTPLAGGFPQPEALKYSPFLRPLKTDSTYSFISGALFPVVDKSDNMIFNIDGDPISYIQSRKIANELEHINILFVIEPSSAMAGQYPMLLNIIQNLRTTFSAGPSFTYRFAASIAVAGTIRTFAPEANYGVFLDSLVSLTSQMETKTTQKISPWATMKSGLKLFETTPSETNLVIVIGEKGNATETAPDPLITLLNQLNCRILGIQLNSSDDNTYNNFVLQLTHMIEKYSEYQTTAKRKKIVFADQYRRPNLFKEVWENFYMLDYPHASMMQGGILFPAKGQALENEFFPMAIDTILSQIQYDNRSLSSGMELAFATVGNIKDRYDNQLSQIDIPPYTKLTPEFRKMFVTKAPLCYLSAGRVELPDNEIQYKLMLSKPELENVKTKLETLCKMELDIKDVAKPSKKKTKDLCRYLEELENLTEEELETMKEQVVNQTDTTFASTKKIRKHLREFYLSAAKNCRICQIPDRRLKQMTLAEVHEEIFGTPSNYNSLKNIQIKKLKKRRKFTDNQLDTLIKYFKNCKDEFEKKHVEEQFLSGSQPYYYIDSKLLP